MIQFGTSVTYLDYVLEHQLRVLSPQAIVDFGAGEGKNGALVRRVLGKQAYLIGVEGCEKTVLHLEKCGIYNVVEHTLLQKWLYNNEQQYDLALFGDVLEHLYPRKIHKVVKLALQKFKHVIIIVPLHNIFQGKAYDNPLEEHCTYVTQDFFDRYMPREKHIYQGRNWTIMSVVLSAQNDAAFQSRAWARKVFHVCMIALQPIGLAKPLVTFLKRFFNKQKWLLFNGGR